MDRYALSAGILFISSVLCFFPVKNDCYAADKVEETETWDMIKEGILSSFDLPLGDLLKKKHESEWRNLFSGFSVGLNANYPLTPSKTNTNTQGSGAQGERTATNLTYSLSLKYNPLSYWFFSTSLVQYKDKDLQKPWNPDFTYCFGYNDWHPYTLSLTYCNYGGNRLNPNKEKKEKFTQLKQGGITLAWKFPLSKKIQKALLIDERATMGCNTSVTWVPDYTDLKTNSLKKDKTKLSFGCKYTIWGWWYWNFQLNYYPIKGQQQPWDPDFTYGFGYFDWHPGQISIQYNNYSGNRFPWRESGPNTGAFRNGSISISWSMSF